MNARRNFFKQALGLLGGLLGIKAAEPKLEDRMPVAARMVDAFPGRLWKTYIFEYSRKDDGVWKQVQAKGPEVILANDWTRMLNDVGFEQGTIRYLGVKDGDKPATPEASP